MNEGKEKRSGERGKEMEKGIRKMGFQCERKEAGRGSRGKDGGEAENNSPHKETSDGPSKHVPLCRLVNQVRDHRIPAR
jgi:hypothetical protein